MKRILKMILLILASCIGILVVSTFLFIKLSPQFGASKKDKLSEQTISSGNFKNGAFENAEKTVVMSGFKLSTLKEYFKKEGKEPKSNIPVIKISNKQFQQNADSTTKFTWFGHSAILLETKGKNIFIDPMLGNVPAPLSSLGPKRFNSELPMLADSLPFLDIVLISHDHFDHLDYESIMKIKDKTGAFYVPLGVGAHLRSWGIEQNKIIELDWWNSAELDGIQIIATPARHFSGRGLTDRNSTLWCSFVISTNESNIFFSGDGGYGEHFKEIGTKFGPFDLCFLECGQYNEQWAQIHMMPEQVIAANIDLQGKQIVPIHWGSFKLALHSWAEPVERLMESATDSNVKVITPLIGERVILEKPVEFSNWWLNY